MPYAKNHTMQHIAHTADECLAHIKHEKIKFVDLQFTGLDGQFHHTTLSADSLGPDEITDGLPKLDGSSIAEFASIDDSDMILKPDPHTLAVLPWSGKTSRFEQPLEAIKTNNDNNNNKTARLICDIYWGGGRGRLEKDPRYIAQRAEEYVKQQGFDFSTWGPEVEFFVFERVRWDVMTPYKTQSYVIESKEAPWSAAADDAGDGYPMEIQKGYYPAPPSDTLCQYRNDCVNILHDNFGILCDNHHHEVGAAGQCEIDMMYDHLANSADSVQSYKYVIKNVAKAHGKVATMMPKPVALDAGSGMHVNVSLWRKKKNVFFDESEPDELSQTARYFCGGLLEHAAALCAICNPTTNSYRRLVPGYEAPVYITWSTGNRSSIIRVPRHMTGTKYAHLKRLEFRAPDPSSNPYLVFAAVAAAGIDGIRKKREPGEQVNKNTFGMSHTEREKQNIQTLPATLGAALDALESDSKFLLPVFSKAVLESMVRLGRHAQREIDIRPHPHEFALYFDV